jgi:hypothetical protein
MILWDLVTAQLIVISRERDQRLRKCNRCSFFSVGSNVLKNVHQTTLLWNEFCEFIFWKLCCYRFGTCHKGCAQSHFLWIVSSFFWGISWNIISCFNYVCWFETCHKGLRAIVINCELILGELHDLAASLKLAPYSVQSHCFELWVHWFGNFMHEHFPF